MTVPPTRDELLELAELDALGALEPAEQARFERGLRDAAPALRAELQAIQDAAVLGPIGLCDEEPEAALKYKVMARIADAVSESEAELAPIASIGRPAMPERPVPAVAPIVAADLAARDVDVLQRVTQAAEQTELERLRARLDHARGHGYMLRAACIALAACLVVAGYALVRQDSYAKQITLLAISQSSTDDLKALLGPTIEPFLRDGVSTGALTALAPKATGGALIWVDPATGNGFVAFAGADPTRSYDLVAVVPGPESNERGLATGLKAFGAFSGLMLVDIPYLKGWHYQLRDSATGDVIYAGLVK